MKRWLILITVLGGAAVLGSYGLGDHAHADAGTVLWGGVPQTLRPLYSLGMLAAALGYFAFTGYLLFGVDAQQARVGKRYGFGIFNLIYVGILVPSALWMPLTFAYLEQPSAWLWWIICLVLLLVGIASLGLLTALLALKPRRTAWAFWLAVAGIIGFSFQTAILDALVWTANFLK